MPDARRPQPEALIEQLGSLLVELEVLGPLLAEMPPDLLSERPAGRPSVIDAFAGMLARDRKVLGLLRDETADERAPTEPISEVLAALRQARERLIESLSSIEGDWDAEVEVEPGHSMKIYELAEAIMEQDIATLRELGDLLRSARLFERPKA